MVNRGLMWNLIILFSILTSTIIITVKLQDKPYFTGRNLTSETGTQLLTQEELVQYLHVTNEDIEKIISEEKLSRKQTGLRDAYQFLPYIELKGKRLFLKSEVDKWLEYLSKNRPS
ncbi:hypothetical protein ABEX47_11695 [Paenibacillus ehimensis]|uniref:hypothetical protein n=1 Tax=Paenibacillus ehimensis TaxID=79264 RepID=UPI003D2A180C